MGGLRNVKQQDVQLPNYTWEGTKFEWLEHTKRQNINPLATPFCHPTSSIGYTSKINARKNECCTKLRLHKLISSFSLTSGKSENSLIALMPFFPLKIILRQIRQIRSWFLLNFTYEFWPEIIYKENEMGKQNKQVAKFVNKTKENIYFISTISTGSSK